MRTIRHEPSRFLRTDTNISPSGRCTCSHAMQRFTSVFLSNVCANQRLVSGGKMSYHYRQYAELMNGLFAFEFLWKCCQYVRYRRLGCCGFARWAVVVLIPLVLADDSPDRAPFERPPGAPNVPSTANVPRCCCSSPSRLSVPQPVQHLLVRWERSSGFPKKRRGGCRRK